MSKNRYSYYTTEKIKWTDIIIGICFALALLSIGLLIAINFRPLYYLDIKWFDIVEKSGYDAVTIKENYNALIDYCSPFFTGSLVFPSIPSSASAISHFAEVKVIFNIIDVVGLVSLIVTVAGFIMKHRRKSYRYLRTCAITSVALPAVVLIFSLIDFNTLFVLFHKIVFSNDDWLFNPKTDPIILMLPESFFAQCAIIIAVTMIIGALVTFLFYRHRIKQLRDVKLTPPKKNYIY